MHASMFKTALTLGLLAAVGTFAIDMYLPALPAIAESLNTSVTATQLTLTAYFITFGLAQMVYGPWADHAGRKLPLYAGLGVFLGGSILCGLAPSITVLVIGRIIQAAGAAVLMVVPRAVIRDLYTGPDATRMMAMIMLVISVSPMLPPLVGSGILLFAGWRVLFALFAVAAVFGLWLLRSTLSETLKPENRVPLNLTSIRQGCGILLRDRGFMALTLVGGFAMSSFFVFIATAPFVYTGHYGLTPTGFSIAFAVNAIGFFLASQGAGKLGEMIGMDRLILIGTLGFAATVAGLLAATLTTDISLFALISGLFIANAFLGVVIPASMVLALEEHGEIAGLASSLGGTLQMVMGGVMVVVSAPLFDGGPFGLVSAIFTCAVLAAGMTAFLRR